MNSEADSFPTVPMWQTAMTTDLEMMDAATLEILALKLRKMLGVVQDRLLATNQAIDRLDGD